ncbi:unnamed protein product [Calypogeia fissa]
MARMTQENEGYYDQLPQVRPTRSLERGYRCAPHAIEEPERKERPQCTFEPVSTIEPVSPEMENRGCPPLPIQSEKHTTNIADLDFYIPNLEAPKIRRGWAAKQRVIDGGKRTPRRCSLRESAKRCTEAIRSVYLHENSDIGPEIIPSSEGRAKKLTKRTRLARSEASVTLTPEVNREFEYQSDFLDADTSNAVSYMAKLKKRINTIEEEFYVMHNFMMSTHMGHMKFKMWDQFQRIAQLKYDRKELHGCFKVDLG